MDKGRNNMMKLFTILLILLLVPLVWPGVAAFLLVYFITVALVGLASIIFIEVVIGRHFR